MLLGVARVEVDVGGFDREPAALRHRVAGVDHEIHQHLLDLTRVGAHPPQVRRGDGDERDVLADEPPQHAVHFSHDDVEVQDLGLEHLAAAVGEQLAGEPGRPLRRLADLFHIAAHRVPGRQVAQQQLRVAEDRREQVVEVVRDAAGELAHRLHFLRLAELLLEAALLGDVALRAPDPHQVPVLDEAHDVVQEDARLPLAIAFAGLRVGQAVARTDEAAHLLPVGGVALVVEVGEPGAHEVVGFGKSVHPRHRVVALGDGGAGVHRVHLGFFGERHRDGRAKLEARHAFRALGDEGSVALLALAQRAFGLFALRDVHADREPPALRQRDVGPRGVEDAPVPRPRPEVGPLARGRPDGVLHTLAFGGVGVQVGEEVAGARIVHREAQYAGPLAVAPFYQPRRIEEHEHDGDVLDDLLQQVRLSP